MDIRQYLIALLITLVLAFVVLGFIGNKIAASVESSATNIRKVNR